MRSSPTQRALCRVVLFSAALLPHCTPLRAGDIPVDGGSVPAEAGDIASLPPDQVAPGRLQLWLRGDVGVDCSTGAPRHVSRWADQSGSGRDAMPHGYNGPQCGSGRTIHGVDVPYFSAPGTESFLEQTLDVDLSFVANSSYTVFAVERRTVDRRGNGAWILGTIVPSPISAGCPPATEGIALQFGYMPVNSSTDYTINFTIDHTCQAFSTPVPNATHLGSASLDVVTFDLERGTVTTWINGSLGAFGSHARPVTIARGGAIGRAVYPNGFAQQVDPRFIGEIAEIVAFNEALPEAERVAVQAYLAQRWGLSL
jgi:hypothetical protein